MARVQINRYKQAANALALPIASLLVTLAGPFDHPPEGRLSTRGDGQPPPVVPTLPPPPPKGGRLGRAEAALGEEGTQRSASAVGQLPVHY